jgi:hypothetical protein
VANQTALSRFRVQETPYASLSDSWFNDVKALARGLAVKDGAGRFAGTLPVTSVALAARCATDSYERSPLECKGLLTMSPVNSALYES